MTRWLLNPCHMDNDCIFLVSKWNSKSNTENKILVIWICCDVVFCVQMKCFELKTKQERLQAWCHGLSRDQRSWSHESDLTKIGRNRIIDYPGEDVFGGWLSGTASFGAVEVQAVNLRGRISIIFYISELYLQGRKHIPPWEKECHLQNPIFGGYVSSLEGTSCILFFYLGWLDDFRIVLVLQEQYHSENISRNSKGTYWFSVQDYHE